MVKYQDAALDRTFAALADPTRRALLAQLDERENVSVSELARPFPVSLPAIMKHLDVLSDAGLFTRTKTGRTVSCRLAAAPMQEAMSWLNRYQRFWSERLDRLAAFLEEESCQSTHPRHQTQPHPQAATQGHARQGLRRMDRPRKNPEVVRARRRGRSKRAKPTSALADITRSPSTPRTASSITSAGLSRGSAEREACIHLGVADDARARVFGDHPDQA